MTPIRPPGDGLPDNLPLLTQVADEAPDDLPTLTEVVVEGQAESATALQPDADQEVPAPENGTTGRGTARPYQTDEGANESLRESHIKEEEIQQLLLRLETHIENALAYKLSLNLEQMQRQAVAQAVSELKAELPELLRGALKARAGL